MGLREKGQKRHQLLRKGEEKRENDAQSRALSPVYEPWVRKRTLRGELPLFLLMLLFPSAQRGPGPWAPAPVNVIKLIKLVNMLQLPVIPGYSWLFRDGRLPPV